MKNLATRMIAAVLFGSVLMSSTTGLDSFEIYLNNKLLTRHVMSQPLTLKELNLKEANSSDELRIVFVQCHAPDKTGKNRKISLVDEQGAIVKEWQFADSNGSGKTMVIPVKELLEIQQKDHGKLTLTYTADNYGRYQQLAVL